VGPKPSAEDQDTSDLRKKINHAAAARAIGVEKPGIFVLSITPPPFQPLRPFPNPHSPLPQNPRGKAIRVSRLDESLIQRLPSASNRAPVKSLR
jgi:hypothetical protein